MVRGPHAAASVSDAIAAELRASVHLHGYSGASVARRLRVDPLWVTRRLSGTVEVTVEDLFTICTVIGAEPLDLIAQVTLDRAPGYETIHRQPEVDTESTDTDGGDPIPLERLQEANPSRWGKPCN